MWEGRLLLVADAASGSSNPTPDGRHAAKTGCEERCCGGLRDGREGNGVDLPIGNDAVGFAGVISWRYGFERHLVELKTRSSDDSQEEGAALRVQSLQVTDRAARRVRAFHDETKDIRQNAATKRRIDDLRSKSCERESGFHDERDSLVAAKRPIGLCAHSETSNNSGRYHRLHGRGIKFKGEDAEDLARVDDAVRLLVPVGIELNSSLLQQDTDVSLFVIEGPEIGEVGVERDRPKHPGDGDACQRRMQPFHGHDILHPANYWAEDDRSEE